MAFEHLQGWTLRHISTEPLPAGVAQSEAAQCHVVGVKVCAIHACESSGKEEKERGIGCDMTLLWSSYQVQIRLILNKSLLGSCLFLFVAFSLQPKICFGSILAAVRKASTWQFVSGSRKIMVCMIIKSASCLVWLQKAVILKYWAYLCQRIRPRNFLSKPDIFLVHVTPSLPFLFLFRQ